MNKLTFLAAVRLVIVILAASVLLSCGSEKSVQSENFAVQITDKPLTFCNPLSIVVDSERARRLGEPVIVLHQDDYYLFTGGGGYWCSDNMRDWTYISAPDFPWGCPSVISDGEKLIASGDKGRHDVFALQPGPHGKNGAGSLLESPTGSDDDALEVIWPSA